MITKKDFIQRFPMAVAIISFALIFISAHPLFYLLSVIVLVLIITHEYHAILKYKNIKLQKWLLYFNCLTLFLAAVLTQNIFYFGVYFLGLLAFYIFCYFYSKIRKTHDQIKNKFYILHILWFLLPFMCFAYFSLIERRFEYLFYFIMVVALNDSFSFFGGKYFGKHKLTKYSPNKTIEGSLIGIFVACLLGYILNIYWQLFDLKILVFILILVNFTAQFGDILQSILKRYCGVKDSGTILLGHGGIFDRVDSYLISSIFYYIFLFHFDLVALISKDLPSLFLN